MMADIEVVLAAHPNHIGATILKGMQLLSSLQIEDEEASHLTAEEQAQRAEGERLLKQGLSASPQSADDYEQQGTLLSSLVVF